MRVVLLAVLRPVVSVAILVVVYYLLPLDRPTTAAGIARLVIGPCVVVAIIVWQVRMILRSPYPTLQGIQALAVIVPTFLLVFAGAYTAMSSLHPGSFTEPLTRTDAIYFVMVVFTTVGFGDITPVSEAARIVVTCQMVGDLLILGVVARLILTAVQHRRKERDSQT